jgi:hypothetical protein
MTGIQLTENLAIILMSRFLNHLELLDTINSESIEMSEEIVIRYDKAIQEEHGDAVLRNMLKVGRFLGENEEIKWIGSDKRSKTRETRSDTADRIGKNQDNESPLAFVVMMDKVCKIGRRSNRVISISTCLKFFAAILVSCPFLTENLAKKELEPAFLSMLKFIDHVQTFTISRDQVKSKDWRSCLELASTLLDRLKTILGDDRHSALNLRLVKSMSAAKIKRREEKRQMVLVEPDKAAKLKQKENQKKYRSRKNNNSKGYGRDIKRKY